MRRAGLIFLAVTVAGCGASQSTRPIHKPPIVGTAGEPAVTCVSSISVGASVQSALAAALPGQVVCLNAGNWPQETITGLTPASPGVTLAAKPGAAVVMAGLKTTGQTNNLTVEGIKFTSTVDLLAGADNITLQYNNVQNIPGYGIQACSVCVNSGPSITHLSILYNQIDHVLLCLRGAGSGSGWTFSHNVCGPGIGNGANTNDGGHYTQAEGINNYIMDNNAFEGPYNTTALSLGAHNNVTHACGNNEEFNNNIVWHSQSKAQTVLWGDDCSLNGAQARNNLFVEDPACNDTASTCPDTVSLWAENAYGTSNVNFSNNTILGNTGGTSGGIWTKSGITNLVSQNNISVNSSGGYHDFSFGGPCTCSGNVANDGSGDISWAPSWQNTSWAPNNGSPWIPPPASYYKPNGIASTYGYQGTIGP